MVIYASPRNPGSKKAAQMLKRSQPGLVITQLPPIHRGKKQEDKSRFSSALEALTNLAESATGIEVDHDGDIGWTEEQASRARQLLESEAADEAAMVRQRAILRLDEVPTIMLLYLNGEIPFLQPLLYSASPTPLALLTPHLRPPHLLTHPCSPLDPAAPRCTGKTFLGEAGAELGKELLDAKRAGFPILMLHENDPAKYGCEFSVFFDGRTPSDLMQEGIYSALALALYPGEFQATSVALAALALGATEVSPRARLKARLRARV